MNLHKIYHPITATPFQCTQDYMEFAPCDALKPYIRCFWGSEKAGFQADTMMYHANTMELYFETEDFESFIVLWRGCEK